MLIMQIIIAIVGIIFITYCMVKFVPNKDQTYTDDEKEQKREGRKMALIGTILVIVVLIILYILERLR